MITNREPLLGLGISILGAVILLSPVSQCQAAQDSAAAGPVVSDWSQHHVIFSRPATAEQTRRVERDPRYWQQLARQSAIRVPEAAASRDLAYGAPARASGKKRKLRRDWAEDLGSGAKVGAANYPAKYQLQTTTASCASAAQPDFVIYATGLAGATSQASIAAYDNLYSGCGGTVPMVYWAYNTGGTVTTSPVFSRDGTQVAFTQNDPSGHGMLVLIKWAPSATDTIGAPTTLTRLPNALYPACTAPCMTTTVLTDTVGTIHSDTNSSVFYDYTDDIAYVGDDSGWLHQIGVVFNGVPAEVRSAGWPVQLNLTPTPLGNPVFDSGSGRVFVTDVGGFLYRIGPGTAFVASSAQLDFSKAEGGAGFVQGPIVDSTAGTVYAFSSSDGSASCNPGAADCAAVFQFTVNFPGGAIGGESIVGASTISGSAPAPLYIGAFDSTYLNSPNPPTGNLYVCGNTGGPPILYQVSIQAGAMNGLGLSGPVLSSITPTPCSPVTDVLNPNTPGGPTEWIFASAETDGASSGCASGGCIFNFKDTPWLPSTAYRVGQEVLDNHFQIQVVSVAGTSGAAAPGWSAILGHSTMDGSVQWLDQGPQSPSTLAAWKPSHLYSLHARILDPNNNVEFVTTAGTSGGSIPTFNTTAGGITNDGAIVVWTNLGALGTASLPAAGGTSGIIIDNIVGAGTQAGASQVYFSTLSDQACGTSGTGGCAVQASQSALQ